MSNIISILLTIIYIGSGFLGLLPYHIKFRYYILFTGYLFVIYAFIAPFLRQWITFPLVLGAVTFIFLSYNRSIFVVILSLTGYFVSVFSNHLLTIPLTIIGISFSDITGRYNLIFLVVVTLLNFLLLFLMRKLIKRLKLDFLQNCPFKIQLCFLMQFFLCIILMTVNFAYGDAIGYPSKTLTFNGLLIFVFTLFTLILFYLLCQLLQENYELKLQKKELILQQNYTTQMESFYEEFRVFRHDYKNILSTLSYYINEQNYSELQKYFEEKILPSGELLSSNNYVIGKLHLVKIPSIKGILYTKLVAALNRGLTPTLELTEPLIEISIDELILTRLLGILLDNSIEASLLSSERLLSVAIVITDKTVIFSFSNSCPPLDIPISKLYEKGFTTKEKHDGLGLYTLKNITDSLDNVSYSVQYDTYFKQTLEIGE